MVVVNFTLLMVNGTQPIIPALIQIQPVFMQLIKLWQLLIFKLILIVDKKLLFLIIIIKFTKNNNKYFNKFNL